MHIGLILALISVLILFIFIKYTVKGFETRLIGTNKKNALYLGINIKKITLLIFLLSGGLAGLAGVSEICGIQHRLLHQISTGYGFSGIIVAWLSKANPILTIFIAFFISILITSAEMLQISMSLPFAVGKIVQALILFCILGAQIFINFKLKLKK